MEEELLHFVTNLVGNEIKKWLSHHEPPDISVIVGQEIYDSMVPNIMINRLTRETELFEFKKNSWTYKISIMHKCYTSLITYIKLTTEGILLLKDDTETIPSLISIINSHELVTYKFQCFHEKFIVLFNHYMDGIPLRDSVIEALPKLYERYELVVTDLNTISETAYKILYQTIMCVIPRPFTENAQEWLYSSEGDLPLCYDVFDGFSQHLQYLMKKWLNTLIRDISHDIYLLYIEGFIILKLKTSEEIHKFCTRLRKELKQILAYLESFDMDPQFPRQDELFDVPLLLGKLLTANVDDIIDIWTELTAIHSVLTIRHLEALLESRHDISTKKRQYIIAECQSGTSSTFSINKNYIP